MNNNYDIDQVERYFDRELSETELIEFQERVANDVSFKMLVEQEKALIDGIRLEGLKRDLKYLENVERTLNFQQTITPARIDRIWFYAAAAAIFIFTSIGLFFYSSNESSEELFTAYFDKPYPNIFEPTLRDAAGNTSDRIRAFQAYEQGDYAKAVTLFNELLKTKKEPGVLMLLGNANLMLGRVEDAKQNFLTLLNDFDELDLPAKWFLSLCYLKSGDVENARKVLKELGGTEVSYATKAKELLNKVD